MNQRNILEKEINSRKRIVNEKEILTIIKITNELKNKKNNEFFIIKDMIMERISSKKDCN